MRQLMSIAVVVLLAAGAASCDESANDVTSPTPTLQPTLSSIQDQIFNTTDARGRAACIQCHTDQGRSPAGDLVLLEGRSFANLVSRPSSGKPGAVRVIPGDADGSYLIHKLEGRADIVGERMPRTGGPYLTDDQIRVIRMWIENGALND